LPRRRRQVGGAVMERHFHGASHLGRGGIELEPLTIRELYNLPITRSELEKWAYIFAARFDIALRKGIEVRARAYEANMIALTEWANEMAEVLK
jgi:hypothetical protein